MKDEYVPFRRKPLYLILTIPMIFIYIAMAAFLWQIGVTYFAIYCSFFVLVAFFMSYVCVYWQCPYVGKFAPCVGGFCLPSSQIARLFKTVKRSETRYNIFLTLAYVAFFGIILFPLYFLFRYNILIMLLYLVVIAVYGAGFMSFICPVCATRHICPGGQTAIKIQESLKKSG